MDPVLLVGAIVAILGCAAFGFVSFFGNESDSGYEALAQERREILNIKAPKKGSKSKNGKKDKKSRARTDRDSESVTTEAAETTAKAEAPAPVKEKKQPVVEKKETQKPKAKTPEPKEAPKQEAAAPKATKSQPKAQAKKQASEGSVIPAGKLTEEEGEKLIGQILKGLGGRVPKGSKVTLASNAENLKKKNDELKQQNDKTQAELNKQLSKIFDLESQIQVAKKEASDAKKISDAAKKVSDSVRDDSAKKVADLESKLKNAEATNVHIQAALSSAIARSAAVGDAEELKSQLQVERQLRLSAQNENVKLNAEVAKLGEDLAASKKQSEQVQESAAATESLKQVEGNKLLFNSNTHSFSITCRRKSYRRRLDR